MLASIAAAIAGFPLVHAVEAQSPGRGHRTVETSHAHLTHWTAVSTTAMGITGDVELGEHQLVFDDVHSFHIEKIRRLTAPEVDATKELTGNSDLREWDLYKIDIPASAKLNHGNTMCGKRSTTKVIMAQGQGYGGTELSLIFFSGSEEPFFKGWRESHTGVCASFGYVRN